jgi:hypothetical protein
MLHRVRYQQLVFTNKNIMKKLLCFVLLLALINASCIKKEYDLNKELDLNIRINSSIFIPIGSTDSLFLRNFFDIDSIDMLKLFNGGIAFFYDTAVSIPLDELNDLQNLGLDTIRENFDFPLNFSDFSEFPTITFPDVKGLETDVDSEFWLPDAAIGAIKAFLPSAGGSISIATLNHSVINNPTLAAALAFAGVTVSDYFPLPTDTSLNTTIVISVDQSFQNDYISSVNKISLTANSGFSITAEAENVPDGIVFMLDTLRLVFPAQIVLDVNATGVESSNVFLVTNTPMTTGTPLNLNVPILHITNTSVGKVELDGEIQVFAKYSLGGAYSGGDFPNCSTESTRLELKVTPNLTFESATVTLNPNKITDELSVEESFELKQSVEIPDIINIISIDNVTLQGEPKIRLDMNFASKTNLTGSIVDDLEIELTVNFPSFINFEPSPQLTGNVYKHNVQFVGGKAQPIILGIQGLALSDKLNTQTNTFEIDEEIKISAEISLRGSTFTIPDPIFDIDDLVLEVSARIDSIIFEAITARISYELEMEDDIPTIDLSTFLSDLPDFLSDNLDKIVLDVNPHLVLTLNSNLAVPVGVSLDLVPFRNGTAQAPISININIPPSTSGQMKKTKFWISDIDPNDGDYVWIKPENDVKLNSLIKQIPDSIQVEVGGGISSDFPVTFDFTQTYQADMDLQFVVPLSVGPEFEVFPIEYAMDSLFEPFVGELLNGNKIALVMSILHDFPLDLLATIIPADSLGRPIPGIVPAKLDIKAGAKLTDPPSRLEFDDSQNKNRGLINMRGVILQFEAKTGTGMAHRPLHPDNFIQARIQVELHGGVSLDLRNLFNSNDEEEGGN